MVREMLSDITVARWMQCATNDMLRNNRTDIRCPCRRCKLQCMTEPYSGILERHLKHNGLMDGYTRWISDEAGEEEDVNAQVNEEGQPDNNGGGEDEEHLVHDHEENAEADHEDQDVGHDEDSSWVRDRHVQELLVKEAVNARGAAD